MLRFFTPILFAALPILCFGQHVASFNLGLIQHKQSVNPQEMLHVLVEGNPADIASAVTLANGRVKYVQGDIASVSIPAYALDVLLFHQGVKRVEGYHGIGKILDEKTDTNTNAHLVKAGASPLTQSYDGDGVVMGIIDTGIDFTHPDFKDASGNTRIVHIWDQTAASGGTTPSFGYGQEWNSADIDAGNCTHVEQAQFYGHGSNVSGAAAGNGLALNKYAGIATKSSIISIAVDRGPNMLNNVADGVQYIFEKAAQLDMPASVSASVGSYSGSHDGTDLPAQLINQLIAAQSGRSMAAAAGNAGNVLLHLGYDVEADSAYSWFRYEPTIQRVYYELWSKKSNFNNVWFSLGADKGQPTFTKRAATDYYNVLVDFDLTNGLDSLRDTLYADGNLLGVYTIFVNPYNDSTYQIAISIRTDSTSYLWRLTTKGSGYFDCWAHPQYTGTSNIVKPTQLPSVAVYPDVARYRAQDYSQNLVSSFQCSDHVITVANYVNRNAFQNHYGTVTSSSDTVGARFPTSSVGPTRDNRIKPDISAPGATTLAPGQLSTLAVMIANNDPKVAEGGMHNSNGGTSMAAPVVGGIAALYLQKNPDAPWYQIKDAIKLSAIQDQFTGTVLPDTKWGYGKIDAFGMLITDIIYGCDDTTALNYDSTTTVAVSDSCLYDFLVTQSSNSDGFVLYPNPSERTVYIVFKSQQQNALVVTDVTGRRVYTARLPLSENVLKLDVSHWQRGIYSVSIFQNGKRVRTSKLVKL